MLFENNILINTETRLIEKKDKDFLGVVGENNIEELVFKMTSFIDGTATLVTESYRQDGSLQRVPYLLEKENNSYTLVVDSSLLSSKKDVKMVLLIASDNRLLFKSETFKMRVIETIPEAEDEKKEYSSFVDKATSKINEMNVLKQLLEQAENERVIAENKRIAQAAAFGQEVQAGISSFNTNAQTKVTNFNANANNKTNEFINTANNKIAEIEALNTIHITEEEVIDIEDEDEENNA